MAYGEKDDSFFIEKPLDSIAVFDGKVLHVRKDTIALPNGTQSTREYCIHNGAVAIVPMTQSGEIIFVRQYRYALGRVTLEIPAGKLDYIGEVPASAALRELREETGYKPDRLIPIGNLNTSPALLTEIIYMYLALGLTPGDTDFDDDENIEIVSIPIEKAVSDIIDGVILDSKTQAAVLKVWAMKQKGMI